MINSSWQRRNAVKVTNSYKDDDDKDTGGVDVRVLQLHKRHRHCCVPNVSAQNEKFELEWLPLVTIKLM